MSEYDVCVVGGGISGLYCAYKLSKKKKVILFDDRTYIGGRIQTHECGYEVGAARFNNNHKGLLKLIRTFKLTPVKLAKRIDYINQGVSSVEHIPNIETHYGKLLDYVINNTVVNSNLHNITFFKHTSNLIGKQKAQMLVDMFGYYSEIKEMNAYDAYVTFKTDFGNIQYFVLKEGLSELCERMKNEIQKNGSKVILKNAVCDVKKIDVGFLINTNTNITISARKVIFAIKPYQLKQFKILSNIRKLPASLYEASLIRIYARYPKPLWFEDIHRCTTNNQLRQIIPIDKESGLIMVSYTDGKDTLPFMDGDKLKTKRELKQIVKNHLKALFPDKHIPEPTYFNAHLWTVGCHHFRPKYDSNRIRKIVMNPGKDIFVCGEGFSSKQAWIEGGLETADDVMSIFF
jgi:protoporphyrinogen oxidase